MNINVLEDRLAISLPRPIIQFVIVPLTLILYTMLYRKWLTKNININYHWIVWLIGLFPLVYYQCLYQIESIIKQILIMALLQFVQLESISWALLMFMQPNMFLLLPYVYLKKGGVETLLLLVKVIAIFFSIHGFSYFSGISGISYLGCQISTAFSPQLYKPNFSLMWLFYSHLFQSHRALYDCFFLAFQLLCLYPLSYISKKVAKESREEFEPALLCILLFVMFPLTQLIYFFSIDTTAGDMAFHMLMFISASSYIRKEIVGAFAIFLAMVMLYFLSLAVSYEWGHSFTIPTSYVFFMLMPFWVSEVAIVTEMVSSTMKQIDVSKEVDKKAESQSKLQEEESKMPQEKKE